MRVWVSHASKSWDFEIWEKEQGKKEALYILRKWSFSRYIKQGEIETTRFPACSACMALKTSLASSDPSERTELLLLWQTRVQQPMHFHVWCSQFWREEKSLEFETSSDSLLPHRAQAEAFKSFSKATKFTHPCCSKNPFNWVFWGQKSCNLYSLSSVILNLCALVANFQIKA